VVFMYRFHRLIIVIDPIASVLLVLGKERVYHESILLSFSGEFLVLIHSKIEQVNGFHGVIIVA